MAYEFRLQDPGEGIHEAEIIEIIVSKGDRVKEGDDVLVAETDKAAVDIPSPISGKIAEIRVSAGDIVEVGEVLMVIEEEEGVEVEDASEEAEEKEDAAQDVEPDEAEDPDRHDEWAEAAKTEGGEGKPDDREGSRAPDEGREGERDSEAAGGKDADVLATPAVRGLARELGVDLEEVSGSGKDGRILEEDVRNAVDAEAQSDEQAPVPSADAAEEVERVKLRSIRRSTAKRMAQAWREIPHVTHHDAVDITEIERIRRQHTGERERNGVRLTLTPFIMKALAGALHEHPRFNARFDAENLEIELVRAINIGVALDTDRGLLVPVVRNVQRKSVLELAAELRELSETIKTERASPAMLKGGTITLTNVGSIGGTGLSPIINPPQVAIFGAARAELRQVLEGDMDRARPETKLILPVCVAFDHRVNDGADAARFMNTIKLLLSDPEQLALRS